MNRLSLLLLFLFSVLFVRADSWTWPPAPYIIPFEQGRGILRFEPVLAGKQVSATKIQSFLYSPKSRRYELVFDRELRGDWRPSYAAPAANPDVLILAFMSPDVALIVLDTAHAKILDQKSYSDLLPDVFAYDFKNHSVSSVDWCEEPQVLEKEIRLIGGILSKPDKDAPMRSPTFLINRRSYEITREPR